MLPPAPALGVTVYPRGAWQVAVVLAAHVQPQVLVPLVMPLGVPAAHRLAAGAAVSNGAAAGLCALPQTPASGAGRGAKVALTVQLAVFLRRDLRRTRADYFANTWKYSMDGLTLSGVKKYGQPGPFTGICTAEGVRGSSCEPVMAGHRAPRRICFAWAFAAKAAPTAAGHAGVAACLVGAAALAANSALTAAENGALKWPPTVAWQSLAAMLFEEPRKKTAPADYRRGRFP